MNAIAIDKVKNHIISHQSNGFFPLIFYSIQFQNRKASYEKVVDEINLTNKRVENNIKT